ncbi:MAG TPA: hypothetical protein VL727_24495 [Puia sp.]|nr:hypothetical protein [Puia sp.]
MNEIRTLLEKYFLAETTLEEEKVLADHFRSGEVDAELLPYAAFFEYIAEEKQVSPGEDLEKRILERVGLETATVQGGGHGAGLLAPVRRLRFGYAAAAAVLLCVSSLFLAVQLSSRSGDGGKVTVPRGLVSATIKDTYDDPEKALAAVRHALLVASTHMNEGKNITQKNMSRLNNSWEAATGN